MGWGLAAGGVLTRVVKTDSGIVGGIEAIVTPVETGVEGAALVLVEVEVVGGTLGLRTKVTVFVSLALVALDGRALS